MKDQELVNALRYLCPGNFTCARCEYEPVCHGDGCAIIQKAADRIANHSTHIAALQQEIEKLRGQVPRWIPVEERLPENGVPVLINYIASDDGKYHPDGTAVWTDYGCFWWEGSLEDCDTEVAVPITHWMPLPEPPEVK